jgi:hypothetical protein
VEPTVPLPGAGAPGQFPPPTDPWATPEPPPPIEPVTPIPAQPMSPAMGGGTVVAQIAEIAVTSTAAHTPAGEIALAGSTWQVADYWQTEQRTPRWAVVLAVLGFFVVTIFSLLFLLVKESIHRGTVQVTVTNGSRQYVARIPVTTQEQVQQVHQQVNYVRALAAL